MARFFDCGLTRQELMKRAFRIKPVASNLPSHLSIPADMRKKFTEMHFTQPTDLELGSLDDESILREPADMLTPVRTVPLVLNARGQGMFMPMISELLAAVPVDLLDTVTAFSVQKDEAQPLDAGGHQRALVTYYTGDLPKKVRDEYIIYDGRAYSPDWRLMEKLERIEVMKPIKLKGPGL